MEPVTTKDQPASQPIRFRAGKKRKAYRQRSTAEDDAAAAAAAAAEARAPSPHGADLGRDIFDGHDNDDRDGDAEHAEESAVAAALRLRNARRTARLRGVGFRSEGRPGDDPEHQQHQALVLREADGASSSAAVYGISNRFMHQTGLLAHLDDAHMNAYIESRLASRNAPSGTSTNNPRRAAAAAANASDDDDDLDNLEGEEEEEETATTAAPGNNKQLRDQPTKQGKLVEVDIPSDIRDRDRDRINENKRRRVEKPNKPPRRQRNRRNSDDIARDNLVEQFLHENRLDVYDVPPAPEAPSASVPGQDPSADDRLAEQFRQQYLDEQALRRKKKRPAQQQQPRQQTGDVLKGPKLGGSRNVRSAVRDILLQQEKEKRGKA